MQLLHSLSRSLLAGIAFTLLFSTALSRPMNRDDPYSTGANVRDSLGFGIMLNCHCPVESERLLGQSTRTYAVLIADARSKIGFYLQFGSNG